MADMYTLQDPTKQYPFAAIQAADAEGPGAGEEDGAEAGPWRTDVSRIWKTACAEGAGYGWGFGDWSGCGDCVCA